MGACPGRALLSKVMANEGVMQGPGGVWHAPEHSANGSLSPAEAVRTMSGQSASPIWLAAGTYGIPRRSC